MQPPCTMHCAATIHHAPCSHAPCTVQPPYTMHRAAMHHALCSHHTPCTVQPPYTMHRAAMHHAPCSHHAPCTMHHALCSHAPCSHRPYRWEGRGARGQGGKPPVQRRAAHTLRCGRPHTCTGLVHLRLCLRTYTGTAHARGVAHHTPHLRSGGR